MRFAAMPATRAGVSAPDSHRSVRSDACRRASLGSHATARIAEIHGSRRRGCDGLVRGMLTRVRALSRGDGRGRAHPPASTGRASAACTPLETPGASSPPGDRERRQTASRSALSQKRRPVRFRTGRVWVWGRNPGRRRLGTRAGLQLCPGVEVPCRSPCCLAAMAAPDRKGATVNGT